MLEQVRGLSVDLEGILPEKIKIQAFAHSAIV